MIINNKGKKICFLIVINKSPKNPKILLQTN